jgi:hypothetical protein
LRALKVSVVQPPEVTHMTLVERAAFRRRPCDNQGDGYRDTLNWLTVLSLASEHPDEQIIWISDNTHDFGTDDGPELHEDLVADLSAVGAEKRVRWIRTLPDLVLTLAAEHAPEAPADLSAIQARLRDEVLSAFIGAEVLAAAVGNALDPRRCGLSTATISAKILAVGEPNELHFSVRGTATNNEAVVEFDLEAETAIQTDLLPGTIAAISTPSESSVEAAASVVQVSKPLKFSGLITLGRYDRPIGGELTRVTAKDDDAGLLQWAVLDMSNSYPGFRLPRDIFRFQQPIIPENLLRFQQPIIFENILKLRQPIIPENLLKLQLPIIPNNLLKLQLPIIPESILRLRQPIIPESILRLAEQFGYAQASEPSDSEASGSDDAGDQSLGDDPESGPDDDDTS